MAMPPGPGGPDPKQMMMAQALRGGGPGGPPGMPPGGPPPGAGGPPPGGPPGGDDASAPGPDQAGGPMDPQTAIQIVSSLGIPPNALPKLLEAAQMVVGMMAGSPAGLGAPGAGGPPGGPPMGGPPPGAGGPPGMPPGA